MLHLKRVLMCWGNTGQARDTVESRYERKADLCHYNSINHNAFSRYDWVMIIFNVIEAYFNQRFLHFFSNAGNIRGHSQTYPKRVCRMFLIGYNAIKKDCIPHYYYKKHHSIELKKIRLQHGSIQQVEISFIKL